MILHIVAIRDLKAECYGQPNFVVNPQVAARSFADEVRRADPLNMLWKHPADFMLFYLGTYDDQDAKFNLFDIPSLLLSGGELYRETDHQES